METGDAKTVHEMPRWLAWVLGGWMLLILALLAWRAFDVLLLLVLLGIAFVAERTVGDWLQDGLGPVMSKVIFVGLLLVVVGFLLTFDTVRRSLGSVIVWADDVGLHSVVLDRLPGIPMVPPVQGDGVTGNHNPPLPPLEQRPAFGTGSWSRSAPGRSDREPGSALATRLALRVGRDRTDVLIQADVFATGTSVNEGEVEFLVDGRVAATVPVKDGKAEARLQNVPSGSHICTARYLGTPSFTVAQAEAPFRF